MVSANIKRTVGQFKSGKLAPKNLKPLIKEFPNRLVEKADQVLLGLSHTKESIPTLLKQTLSRIENNPNDLVGRVGRSVLERAEEVRKQLIEKAEDSEALLNKRWVPDWLKDVTFVSAAGEPAPLVEMAAEKTAKKSRAKKNPSAKVKASTATAKKPRAKKV